MLEIRVTDPAALSGAEVNAVIMLLQTLRDAAEVPRATAIGPQELKVVVTADTSQAEEAFRRLGEAATATAAPSSAVAEAPTIAPEASAVFSQAGTTAAPLPSTPVTAAVPAPPPSGVETDARGLPWDGRIHASTRVKIADGSWRQKRGVDPALVQTVETELRAALGAPAAAVVAPPPPPVTAAVPTVPEPPPPVAGPQPLSFPAFLQRVTAAVSQGKITQANVLEVCQALGVPNIPVLATRPDLVDAVALTLGV